MTGELYHLYYEEMVHWAVSMTKNLSSAEDLVQETFLRAMKNEQLFKGMEFYQCRSWLYRTARNLYVDWVRHATHEVITETMPEQERFPGIFRIWTVNRYFLYFRKRKEYCL